MSSGNVRANSLDVDAVERLAGSHEQPVSLRSAEADIRAVLRQADHADHFPARRDHLHSGPRTGPDVSVDVAPHSVGSGRASRARNRKLNEAFAVFESPAVNVPYPHLAAGARIGHIQFLVVR